MNPASTTDGKPPGNPPRRERWLYFPRPIAWVVLGISLAASAGGWFIAWQHAELEARKRFDEQAGRIAAALAERMQIYEDVLHGAAGLFAASYSVERDEWHTYMQSVSIERRFPGIDAVGYAARVSPKDMEAFVRATRADHAPAFEVREASPTNDSAIIKFLEPESRHVAMLGWNMAVDQERRAVMEQAAGSGSAALSGRLELREAGGSTESGCLMVLPVYHRDAPTGTVEERRQAVQGWVYARFVLDQLLQRLLQQVHGPADVGLHVKVTDATADGSRRQLFDADPDLSRQRPEERAWFTTGIPLPLGGREWMLEVRSKPVFEKANRRGNSLWVGIGGGLVSLLLFGIAWSLSHTRERAMLMARRMTGTLRETNERLEQEIAERKRSEGALQQSEALYHSLVESLPLSITCKDLQGRLTFANRRFCLRFNKTRAELMGRSDAELFIPEVAARRQQADERVLADGTTLEMVEERPQPDGKMRYVQAIRTPVYDVNHKIVGLLGIFWDVTDKRRAEAELEHERFLLRTLMDNLPERIYFKDLQSRFLRNSKAHLERFGLTDPAQAIGKTDFDFFTEEHAREAFEDEQRLIRTGEFVSKEERETWPDGSVTWAMSTKMPLRDESGKIIGTFGISRDITEHKRAEEALRQSEARYQLMANTIEDVLYGVNGETGEFEYVSPAFERLLGYTLREVAAMGGRERFLSQVIQSGGFNKQKALFNHLHHDGPGGTPQRHEAWWRCKDGKLRCFEDCWIPVYSGKTLTGTYGVLRDITDRKLAEEAMRKAKEAAEEASRAKSQFLASMSHELRTPLNSVIGFANILLKNRAGTLGAAELNFLERILANGKHLLMLINEILDLSKIEARKVELHTAPVAMDALVRETVAQQESLVRDKPVQLRTELPARVAVIPADAEKLKQVIINLIGNALKFTEQGSVTVRVVTDPADDRPLRIEVIDTGIGIPSDKLGVIFEAFQQADAGTARKYGGTGLGLTISQALCQLMDYRIEVTSEVGRGSTFSVWLNPAARLVPSPPVEPPAPAKGEVTATIAPLPSEIRGKTVLVIDDELDSRTLLTHMVEEFGCHAIAASSGEQGLHMAREFRPHLITVDLMMPQLDGWQVIRALKADPELRDIPVVVVSIVAGENRGSIIGGVDVLQKPVQREELLAVLRRSLPFQNPRLLIVDDDEDARRVLAAHIEDETCEICMAIHGGDALEKMERFLPDLILLDLMMPVMDGMTFLNEIRANPRYQWVPVVVVTAKELSQADAEQLRHAAQHVVRKGDVFEADLKSIMRRLLQSHPQRPESAPS